MIAGDKHLVLPNPVEGHREMHGSLVLSIEINAEVVILTWRHGKFNLLFRSNKLLFRFDCASYLENTLGI